MRRFKVKDLMFDVLPLEAVEAGAEVQQFCWRTCHYYISRCHYHISRCHYYISRCHYYTRHCGWFISEWCHLTRTDLILEQCPAGSEIPEIDPRIREFDPRELGVLRKQLQMELEQVEAAEKRVAEQMAPQTIEEVELLQGKLREALGELDALKERMQKG